METIEILAKELEEVFGTCPVDMKDWNPPFDCGERCKTGEEWKCWIEWAKEVESPDG